MSPLSPRALSCAFVVTAVLLGGCGSDGEATAQDDPSAAESMEGMEMGSESMDMSGMDMGADRDATPAEEVADAEVADGEFETLETAPPSYGEVTGTAALARSDAGTTATIRLEGLPPDTEFMSHVHAQPCDTDQGGPHYQFEVGGSEMPPNEIHLPFTSDADGEGFMTAVNEQTAGPDAQAIVVHPLETPDNRVACATLET